MKKFETKPNTGALFKADKEGNPKRPDYSGNLDVEGSEFWISAWIKQSKAGKLYLSLAVQPKREKPQPATRRETQPIDDDDPFKDMPF